MLKRGGHERERERDAAKREFVMPQNIQSGFLIFFFLKTLRCKMVRPQKFVSNIKRLINVKLLKIYI